MPVWDRVLLNLGILWMIRFWRRGLDWPSKVLLLVMSKVKLWLDWSHQGWLVLFLWKIIRVWRKMIPLRRYCPLERKLFAKLCSTVEKGRRDWSDCQCSINFSKNTKDLKPPLTVMKELSPFGKISKICQQLKCRKENKCKSNLKKATRTRKRLNINVWKNYLLRIKSMLKNSKTRKMKRVMKRNKWMLKKKMLMMKNKWKKTKKKWKRKKVQRRQKDRRWAIKKKKYNEEWPSSKNFPTPNSSISP